MVNILKVKRSGQAAQTPSSLEDGELAINYADGKLFYKNSSNSIVRSSINIFDYWYIKSGSSKFNKWSIYLISSVNNRRNTSTGKHTFS
jgi:hypothetical protein